jgi:hypothetical protein
MDPSDAEETVESLKFHQVVDSEEVLHIDGTSFVSGQLIYQGLVSEELRQSIETQLDAIANAPEKDFHPNSDNKVQDLIHPSLFPYIEGESFVHPESKDKAAKLAYSSKGPGGLGGGGFGRTWGRRVETSKYQWMPAIYSVDSEKHSKIESYINNLDRSRYPQLYEDIAKVFDHFIPLFETVLVNEDFKDKKLQVFSR